MPGFITNEHPPAKDVVRVDQTTASWRWPSLAVGSLLLFFSYGANNIGLAAWLAPVFLLHFVRHEKWRVWVPIVYVIQVAASAFQLRGMVPISWGSLLRLPRGHGNLDAGSLRDRPLVGSPNWRFGVHTGFSLRMDCLGLP